MGGTQTVAGTNNVKQVFGTINMNDGSIYTTGDFATQFTTTFNGAGDVSVTFASGAFPNELVITTSVYCFNQTVPLAVNLYDYNAQTVAFAKFRTYNTNSNANVSITGGKVVLVSFVASGY